MRGLNTITGKRQSVGYLQVWPSIWVRDDREQILQVAWVGLEPETAGLWVQRTDHWATLPPCLLAIKDERHCFEPLQRIFCQLSPAGSIILLLNYYSISTFSFLLEHKWGTRSLCTRRANRGKTLKYIFSLTKSGVGWNWYWNPNHHQEIRAKQNCCYKVTSTNSPFRGPTCGTREGPNFSGIRHARNGVYRLIRVPATSLTPPGIFNQHRIFLDY